MTGILIKGRVGPLADRPAQGERIGARYNATDNNDEFEWNGAAWLPVGNRDMIWQAATDITSLAATPTLVTTNDIPAWELDTGDGVCGTRILPHGWGVAEPHLVFYVPAATAGTLSLRLRIKSLGFLQGVGSAYDYDQTINTTTHPQDIPLPMVFDDLPVAGETFTWRVDRSDALAATCRIMGINWERVY